MLTLLGIGALLSLVFGFSSGGYVAFYVLPAGNGVVRSLLTMFLGVLISAITFVLAVSLVWPAVM
ncbi:MULTISPECIES: hypothetical protein [Carboxydocella]|uniref:Uncharacterized protein n=2 Tax=Carboxydocella TaxID=178898 RepID=A0A1T4MJR1_9FIRM|nr:MULTISPECIES: hypothetical protein [Carboxydocella]AVX21353.1 hypothetical protein CFE_2195 [Carboxydocella thermautotrophica]AVX31781.1 hypothetical protein CTH_2224 [Carboxydocella thermautotrophica]SJZ67065.1 hypothetical protein SAMN02745885_00605 [Carboxydocella sporoproducens DSM 16521]GAW28156.1 hypothetical protein ULO1_07260 [Carboxydocella sp. ULO1]GAW31657.1 hypothetical protein JDF658_14220 [Carboxydocella sp. JDF658]